MIAISGAGTGAARPVPGTESVPAPTVRQPGEDRQTRSRTPVMDEYVPEEKQEPSGRYWPVKGSQIYFDRPEQAEAEERPEAAPKAEAPEQERPKRPEKSEKQEERCAGNTDQVDREIEQLKKKQEELKQRIRTETDEARLRELERQLAQVERELSEKDNDAYRRQHCTFTAL